VVTNGKQDPWINSSVKGDFYFRSAGAQARKKVTPSVPAGASAEIVFWQSIKDSTNPASFKAYLSQYPNSAFAGLARVKLNELKPPKVAARKPTPSPPKTRTEPPAPTDQESLFWQSIKGSDNPADYQDYLMAFPNGTFARLAKRRVSELKRKKVAVASPPKPARSRRSEKLRGRHIFVDTKVKSIGLRWCKLLRGAGLIVTCRAGVGSGNGNDIFLKCSTLPSETGEIVQEILGISGFKVWDWRRKPNWGAKYCNNKYAIHIWTEK